MKSFTYCSPVRVYFGEKAAARHLPEELKRAGQTVMLAYGQGSVRRNGIYDEIVRLLADAGKTVVDFPGIMPNPTYAKVQEGVRLAREKKVDFILAVGGGSVMDCCKIIAVQTVLGEDIWQMEVEEERYPASALPTGAVVTAFGTGSEMNNDAVITHEEKKIKFDLVGPFFDFAVLDPEYMMSLPEKQLLTGAFDSLSHCMEIYMGSPREANLSDELNEAVQRSIIRNMRAFLKDPADRETVSELVWASSVAEDGILKLGKNTDFQCHMLEHQLGAYTDCSHGQGLAVIHPVLYRHCLPEAEKQFARLAREVWQISAEDDKEAAAAFPEALAGFVREIGLPSTLEELGIPADTDLEAVAASTILRDGCARRFDAEELLDVLRECGPARQQEDAG